MLRVWRSARLTAAHVRALALVHAPAHVLARAHPPVHAVRARLPRLHHPNLQVLSAVSARYLASGPDDKNDKNDKNDKDAKDTKEDKDDKAHSVDHSKDTTHQGSVVEIDTSHVADSGTHDDPHSTNGVLVEPEEVTLEPDLSNLRSLASLRVPEFYPTVVVIPADNTPLFPEFLKYIEISDRVLISKLRAIIKARQPYAGVFLRQSKEGTPSSPSPITTTSSTTSASSSTPVTSVSQVYSVGTFVSIREVSQLSEGKIGVLLRGHRRIRLSEALADQECLTVKVTNLEELEYDKTSAETKALASEIVKTIRDIVAINPLYRTAIQNLMEMGVKVLENPGHLCDFGATVTTSNAPELQVVLEERNIVKRMHQTLELLQKEYQLAKLQVKIRKDVEDKVTAQQRQAMLYEQLNAIKKELGLQKDDKTALRDKFKARLEGVTLLPAVQQAIDEEMAKLEFLEQNSSEFNVTRNYIDWLTLIPWTKETTDNYDLENAMATLDHDHFGMKDAKDRVVEFIAVGSLLQKVHGKIVCLVGPPGVGKTSIVKSIAKALNRNFFRFSVGGLSDVAEIKGHRRTYLGAMPGKPVQSLKSTQSMNSLILIDEIDKLGRGVHGDPASALLELLDPEQNVNFLDHYLDVPVDMSKILFVCTANVLDTIPAPLLDRMEVIELSGYLLAEKQEIAKRYLIPATLKTTGLEAHNVKFTDKSIEVLIRNYCRESGVRNLQKQIEKILRKTAVKVLKSKPDEILITEESLTDLIGNPLFVTDRLFDTTPPGVAMGLAWTSMGGTNLYIETLGTRHADKSKLGGSFKFTGQLGDVMKESASIAFTYARHFLSLKADDNLFFLEHDVNLHVPEGATPKDGPSAGITMVTALISLATKKSIRANLAMTGELTLTGQVLRVGGIKEKILAAKRAGVKIVLLPGQSVLFRTSHEKSCHSIHSGQRATDRITTRCQRMSRATWRSSLCKHTRKSTS
eukprot:m.187926 g.187926  ORF g.187926 m.187926 type:complete len:973 (-) comp53588_c0_seq2:81-2999(-)